MTTKTYEETIAAIAEVAKSLESFEKRIAEINHLDCSEPELNFRNTLIKQKRQVESEYFCYLQMISFIYDVEIDDIKRDVKSFARN